MPSATLFQKREGKMFTPVKHGIVPQKYNNIYHLFIESQTY